jgi:hypothetical protein
LVAAAPPAGRNSPGVAAAASAAVPLRVGIAAIPKLIASTAAPVTAE